MAYATVNDLVLRFGATEIIRLTTPSDQELDGIVPAVATTALESASAFMDGYIGRRYQVPMEIPPPAITDNCCDIARFKLSTGDQKTCSEEVRMRHTDALRWLQDISLGKVVLDLAEVTEGDESYAQVSVGREEHFGRGGF